MMALPAHSHYLPSSGPVEPALVYDFTTGVVHEETSVSVRSQSSGGGGGGFMLLAIASAVGISAVVINERRKKRKKRKKR